MNKALKIILSVMLVISAALTVYFYLNAPASLATMTDTQSFATTVFLDWAYILLAIAIIASVGLPIINMIGNPKAMKKSLITLAIVVVVCGLAYVLAPGTAVPVSASVTATPADFKMTDTLLYITYFLTGMAIIAIIVGGIVNIVRNR